MNEDSLNNDEKKFKNLIDDLVNKADVLELVKVMKPLDIAKVLAKNLDLKPSQAAKLAVNLIIKANEWLSHRK